MHLQGPCAYASTVAAAPRTQCCSPSSRSNCQIAKLSSSLFVYDPAILFTFSQSNGHIFIFNQSKFKSHSCRYPILSPFSKTKRCRCCWRRRWARSSWTCTRRTRLWLRRTSSSSARPSTSTTCSSSTCRRTSWSRLGTPRAQAAAALRSTASSTARRPTSSTTRSARTSRTTGKAWYVHVHVYLRSLDVYPHQPTHACCLCVCV